MRNMKHCCKSDKAMKQLHSDININMGEDAVLEISIPGWKNIGNKYTEYEVVCITNNKNFRKCYTKVFRRYNDFHRLHCRLKCLIKIFPEFPKKRWDKMCEAVVEERFKMFNTYLKFVCSYILEERENTEKIADDVAAFMQEDY